MSKDALCTLLVYGGHTSSEIRDWLVLAYNGTGQRDAAYGLEEARKALAKVNEAFADYDRVIADELVELRSGTPIKRVGGGGSGGRKSVDIVIGSNGLPQWPATPQPAGAASSAPEAEMVDCPACAGAGYILHGYRRNECDACEGVGEMPAEYADEWVRNHQDTREATDDARLHARLERDGPQPAAAGGAL